MWNLELLQVSAWVLLATVFVLSFGYRSAIRKEAEQLSLHLLNDKQIRRNESMDNLLRGLFFFIFGAWIALQSSIIYLKANPVDIEITIHKQEIPLQDRINKGSKGTTI